ncbi:E2/UBC family protein [Xanthomonas campestris]|uniref:E2/UBC family protein n=1 Tax=Xanthomonas campestris TaxID=339 RepID=UPI001C84FEB9|nr:E2/UBC family protein [Xanthomonas campestris]MCC5051266.1 hypothetical protein [Xanthomonas campestris pv. aberrans]MEB1125962.1 E2/UBC family protein [Xanthomonas campestris pv. campestris]
MKDLADQFAQVKSAYPGASLVAAPDQSYLVLIPGFPLPAGWSHETINLRFVVPTGYPYAVPDCFWTDADLRLSTGVMPQNAQFGQVNLAQTDASLLWFSWHITPNAWNPTKSDLMTYVQVIKRRFEALQ